MRIFRAILCCLFLPLFCSAVKPYTPVIHDPVLEPWRWRAEEALDEFGVMCMDEAPDGTLWFGCDGSIASYDGISVQQIQFDETFLSRISHNRLIPRAKSLLVLPDSSLLALVGESLVHRKEGQWNVVIQNVGNSKFTSDLQRDANGAFWLLVPDTLWRISADLKDASKALVAPTNGALEAFCLSESESLWVVQKDASEKSSLLKLSAKNSQLIGKPIATPIVYERGRFDMTELDDGTLALATSQRISELFVFDPKTEEWISKENDTDNDHYSLLKIHDGTVWFGLSGKLSKLPPGGELIEYKDVGLEFPSVPLKLFQSSDERLWVIVGDIGKVCSIDLGFSEWMTLTALHYEGVTPEGVEWFRYWNTHFIVSHDLRSGEWLMYNRDDGLPNKTRTMLCSSHGVVWACGSDDGRAALSVFDGQKWTRYNFPTFAMEFRPNGLFEAQDGTVWVGAQGPLLKGIEGAGGALQFRVNDDKTIELVKHHSPPEFPYYVTAMEQTEDETLWIGSTMIHSIDCNGTIQQFPEIAGGNTVDMTLDREQVLWVAKDRFGVCRRQNGQWEIFTRKDGLAELQLCDLQLLPDGSILAGTSGGISRFDGRTWTPSVYPKWFNMLSRWNSIRTSPDGAIWFNYMPDIGTLPNIVKASDGFCAIWHSMEKNPPETRITESVEEVSAVGNTYITWTAHDPWNNTPSDQLEYSWRIDGDEWSPFSRDTGHTFLELKRGTHQIEVRARDLAFNVDPSPALIEISVAAPVWMQPWFVVMVLSFSGIIIFLTRLLILNRERHLLEQQKEREKHLEEIDRLKTGFFTNISHELRTPITVIRGRLEKLFPGEQDEKRKKALQSSMRNVERMSALVNQLLDFRKIEEGKLTVKSSQGDLAAPLRDWVTSLRVVAEQKDIAIQLDCPEQCTGKFDFDKVYKIFTNLISNAIKYTKDGGEIQVTLRCLDSESNHERHEMGKKEGAYDSANSVVNNNAVVQFIVEDTGEGIPAEHLGHIFERFYRVSEASIAVGAGIGLNLTKELVDLLGGEIAVESPISDDAAHPGTRFTVSLPLESETVSKVKGLKVESVVLAEDVSVAAVGDRGKVTPARDLSSVALAKGEEAPLILVIEDDEDIREMVMEGFEESYRVETAENGEIGLKKARELVPDLVVSDVMMPVMDGTAMCKELKAGMETSHIPVIILTAKVALDSQIEGLKTGADDYITKPFHMELLQVRAENLLESRRLLREKFCNEVPMGTPVIPENTYEKEFLDKAIGVIEENYSEWEFNREQFADKMNMSVRSLTRKIKAVTDRTALEFLQEYRMTKAAELLVGTTDTVTDILFRVGFDDASHFSRYFKKVYEMTPSQYRAAHQVS